MSSVGTERRRSVTFIRVPAWSPDREAAYEEWYDNIHIPLRMTMPGFLGAQRYHTLVGAQRYFIFYELEDPSAVESREYLNLRVWEQSQPPESFEAPATSRSGFERGIYEQQDGPLWPSDELVTPVVYIAGHTPALGHEREAEAWLAGEFAPALRELDGVAAVRRFSLTDHAFAGEATSTQMHTPRPRLITVSHLSDAEVLEDPVFNAAVGAARCVAALADDEPFSMVGQRVHTAYGASPSGRTSLQVPHGGGLQ